MDNFNFDDLGYWYFCRVLQIIREIHPIDQYKRNGTCTIISDYDTYTTYVDTVTQKFRQVPIKETISLQFNVKEYCTILEP